MPYAQSRPWTRLQDWVSLVVGGYLAFSPLWLDVTTKATWAMVVIGAAAAVLAIVALAMPGAFIDEWMTAVAGGVAVLAPWLFSYTENTAAAWTSWVVGAVIVVAALAAVPASREVYREQHHVV
ncbi:MAG TPA: SPW repeat protein [Dermatophilaceae bacterium]|nr:SPW repeat protein [Dermatophilaceae bacterium]